MKHGKTPTRRQKQLMKKWHLNPDNWWVISCTHEMMEIAHKHTASVKVIPEGIS